MRINLGCGPKAAPGWLNCDVKLHAGVDLRLDIRRGLPFASGSVDGIAAVHVLQDLPWSQIAPLLQELHRVLKAGGVLRLAVPDLDKAIDAYRAGDSAYFYVPDEHARSCAAKLITQIIWYGSVRTPCNFGFLEESLQTAGFRRVLRGSFGESSLGGLAALDNRERESLFVEALK